MKDLNWRHVVMLLIAIPIVTQVATYVGSTLGTAASQRPTGQSLSPAQTVEIKTVVSIQDAEGLTQKNLDIDFLKMYEKDVVEAITRKVRTGRASLGQSSESYSIVAESIYVFSGPTKLAVVRLTDSENTKQVIITGVVGNEFRRVACIRKSSEAIPIATGICAQKISEIFGTPISN